MSPVEWPISAQAGDRAVATTRSRGDGSRAAIARRDYFTDPALRLSEEERALIAAMLAGLVGEIADELKAALPPIEAARADWRRNGLARRLEAAGLLDRERLFELLLRRADENRLAGGDGPTLGELVADEDGAVAGAAMGLVVARGRRRDRFGRLGIDLDDLDAEEAVALIQAAAAAIRDNFQDMDPDALLASAAQALLARFDEGRRLDTAVTELAHAIAAAGRGGDDLLVALAGDGEVALLAALLAMQARIGGDTGWALLAGDEAGGVGLLLRLAGVARSAAAAVIAELAPRLGQDEVSLIDQYDEPGEREVEGRRRWWRLDPAYRAACSDLGGSDGQPRA